MRLILNVIWLVFGGLWLALGYLLAALICFALIVTIPFGFASLRIASYALWPSGGRSSKSPASGRAPWSATSFGFWCVESGWRSAT